jgi:hypothetical protein
MFRPVHEDRLLRQAIQRREGIERLNASNGNEASPANDRKSSKGAKRRSSGSGAGADDVGKALRSAYDEALREDVPDDFLDLLGKLS